MPTRHVVAGAEPVKYLKLPMDVVWLKKDVRIHDHGPLNMAASCGRPFCIVYIYEPDQLSHHSVHGSHVYFANEGLEDLDMRLQRMRGMDKPCITYCKGEATAVFKRLNSFRRIMRLISHEETGHNSSYARDERVRRWCRDDKVELVELVQTGVIRALKNRDNFSKGFNAFMTRRCYPIPAPAVLMANLIPSSWFLLNQNSASDHKEELLAGDPGNKADATIACGVLYPGPDLPSLAAEHSVDRVARQRGGETEALRIFGEFLRKRGEGYSPSI